LAEMQDSYWSCNVGMALPGWKGHFRILLMVTFEKIQCNRTENRFFRRRF